nr:hypothetical protein [Nitrosomonas sp. Nm34]
MSIPRVTSLSSFCTETGAKRLSKQLTSFRAMAVPLCMTAGHPFIVPPCRQGLCGSHLLRELTFIVDAHDYTWARNMKHLLRPAKKSLKARKSV